MRSGMLCAAVLGLALGAGAEERMVNAEYVGDFNYGQPAKPNGAWVQSIRVLEPAYRAEVKGSVTVRFEAPGMAQAQAFCWQQPTATAPSPWGHDVELLAMTALGETGAGAFVFPADAFPSGPTMIRIYAQDRAGKKDVCELQLYNLGGVAWNQGLPTNDPPAAAGMRLVFADDFDGELSVSRDGAGARYAAHKPRFGDFSGWRFSISNDYAGAHHPFKRKGTFLGIRAAKAGDGSREAGSGLISSARFDGSGVWAQAPCYFECRFTAQAAPGTWPAFWLLTGMDPGAPSDELDIIEGYGGVGEGNPNHPGYSLVTHFWAQTGPDGKKLKGHNTRAEIMALGGKSYWSTTFHTYAVKVTKSETIYYFDGFEVLKHPSGPLSASQPFFFLINYAIGGISGWKIDLERYGNATDMWVDYVRVYQGGGKDLSGFRLEPPAKK